MRAFLFETSLLSALTVLAVIVAENEGLTVNTLTLCGVSFVSTNTDLVKRTVSAAIVVCALLYRTLDAFVDLLFHYKHHPVKSIATKYRYNIISHKSKTYSLLKMTY